MHNPQLGIHLQWQSNDGSRRPWELRIRLKETMVRVRALDLTFIPTVHNRLPVEFKPFLSIHGRWSKMYFLLYCVRVPRLITVDHKETKHHAHPIHEKRFGCNEVVDSAVPRSRKVPFLIFFWLDQLIGYSGCSMEAGLWCRTSGVSSHVPLLWLTIADSFRPLPCCLVFAHG